MRSRCEMRLKDITNTEIMIRAFIIVLFKSITNISRAVLRLGLYDSHYQLQDNGIVNERKAFFKTKWIIVSPGRCLGLPRAQTQAELIAARLTQLTPLARVSDPRKVRI
jgi:hypothetical protein